ncbi:MAG: symmetrical bis(5'-nucleosyl)-tetraphosphatase [Rhodoferax sp.]
MALYLIGDIQGCDDALARLFDCIDFSPSRDDLVVLGDLVNRGPASEQVLRRLSALQGSARCLLGNHDLHLLAVAAGAQSLKRKDTLRPLLDSPDAAALLHWLRSQSLALHERIGGRDLLMVHAGVLPSWTLQQTLDLAHEVQDCLRGPQAGDFFTVMYGDEPRRWNDALQGTERLRVIVNALTRLRFCTPDGVMEFEAKDSARSAPVGHLPWFDVPGRRTAEQVVAFGHWSTLGWLGRDDVYGLDLGCVWGGQLAALRLAGRQHWAPELITIDCPQTQVPGRHRA